MAETRSPHESVAEEVRALLARQRMSGRRAARELGWANTYMWRRLSGEAPFDVNDLAQLAGLLNVQVTAFFANFDLDQDSEGVLLPVGSNTQKYWTPSDQETLHLPRSDRISLGSPHVAGPSRAA